MKAASELFQEKGPGDTAIDDIVRRAGVAKGTFYLYFRDRAEILHHLIAQKGANLLQESHAAALARCPGNLVDEILFTVDEAIAREEKNPRLLPLVYKNFSWKLLKQELGRREPEPGSPLARLVAERGEEEAEAALFMLTELGVSVAYNAIALREPAPIEAMRKPLFEAMRRILETPLSRKEGE